MGTDRSAAAVTEEAGPAAPERAARGGQRDAVLADDGLSVAAAGERISAVVDGAAVLRRPGPISALGRTLE